MGSLHKTKKMVQLGAKSVVNNITHRKYASEPKPLGKSSNTSGNRAFWFAINELIIV